MKTANEKTMDMLNGGAVRTACLFHLQSWSSQISRNGRKGHGRRYIFHTGISDIINLTTFDLVVKTTEDADCWNGNKYYVPVLSDQYKKTGQGCLKSLWSAVISCFLQNIRKKQNKWQISVSLKKRYLTEKRYLFLYPFFSLQWCQNMKRKKE